MTERCLEKSLFKPLSLENNTFAQIFPLIHYQKWSIAVSRRTDGHQIWQDMIWCGSI